MNKHSRPVQFHDIQALARFGCAHLKDSHFALLKIKDRKRAGDWLLDINIQSAQAEQTIPDAITQIAFTTTGLSCLGLTQKTMAQFSDEFIQGMAHDDNRSRRLGDIKHNAPENWQWGFSNFEQVHVLILLYTRKSAMPEYRRSVFDERFDQAFSHVRTLPTTTLTDKEPFGFIDGISQPIIDWDQQQSTDAHARDEYSNKVAPGEIVLGYNNEYGLRTPRPMIHANECPHSSKLPLAEQHSTTQLHSAVHDFGGNGTYLVIRQLEQHVDQFWQFVETQCAGDKDSADTLAAAMVGRKRNGTPLVTSGSINDFTFDADPDGIECPISSHIRRSNPRTGDFPPGVKGWLDRLIKSLGFKRQSEYEDLIASTRFHRLLRRGRTYGPSSGEVSENSSDNGSVDSSVHINTEQSSATGLQFICLAGNIIRQFEFVQSAWLSSSAFAGSREQRDPLLGHRCPRLSGTKTDSFMQASEHGVQDKTQSLPDFVTVRGGGYFFMPGISAIRYLGHVASQKDAPQ